MPSTADWIRPYILVALSLAALSCGDSPTVRREESRLPLLDRGQLRPGLELSVGTDTGLTGWVRVADSSLRMDYPAGQSFGFVALVIGPNQAALDASGFAVLEMELRSEGETMVEIGMKDDDDPPGSETRIAVTVQAEWSTVTLPISDFATAVPSRLTVPLEVIFSGSDASTLWVRSASFRN